MKKNCFIFLFSFIYLSILAGCHIRPDEYEEFQNISLSVIGKQIAVETEKALKDKDNTLDELIKKLLAQMDANLAEEYWLYDYKSRRYGETCLELYADNAEDMHYLAILSSGKETFIETERFYTEIYFISEGNIHNLYASWGVCCSTLDEAKRALELQEENPESPLKGRLRELAKFISKIGYIGAFLVVFSYLFSVIVIDNNFSGPKILETIQNFRLLSGHILYALTLAVTIIVVAVPEGLPMMITLVLSSNMKRMLKNNVLGILR